MTPTVTRTLFAHVLHCHLAGKALDDYPRLFRTIAEIDPRKREERIDGRVIALPVIAVEGGVAHLTAYEGEVGVAPLLYDTSANEERIGNMRTSEILATRTHALIDLKTRHVVVEYNRRGAKHTDIADLVTKLAMRSADYFGLSVELAPIPGKEFLEEVDKFRRIRVASVELVRPNFSWDDCEEALLKAADASDAGRVNIEFTAGREQSLSKERGIMGAIRRFFRQGLHVTKKAKITGTKEDSQVEETVNLANYVEKRTIEIERSPKDGHPEPEQVVAEQMAYLNSLRERKTDDA